MLVAGPLVAVAAMLLASGVNKNEVVRIYDIAMLLELLAFGITDSSSLKVFAGFCAILFTLMAKYLRK